MNEKLLSSYFRKFLKKKNLDFIEQVSFRKKRIDFVIIENKDKINTLELKVSDWKTVFNQASKNLLFSDTSYICFWHTFSNRVDMELIKKFNIGLYIIKKKKILEIYSPHKNNKFLKPNYYKSFKAKILNSTNYENLFGD